MSNNDNPLDLGCGKCYYAKHKPTKEDPRIYIIINDPTCNIHNTWFKQIEGVWIPLLDKEKLK